MFYFPTVAKSVPHIQGLPKAPKIGTLRQMPPQSLKKILAMPLIDFNKVNA